VSTFAAYKQKYKEGKYENLYDFVNGLYRGKKVTALVDVWCEAPVQKMWKEIADSAITAQDRKDKWRGLEYWFVMGACYSNTVAADELIITRMIAGVHP
jgi:TatD DNase family protein